MHKCTFGICWASTFVAWAWLMQFGRYAYTVHHVRAVVMTPCGTARFESKLLEVTHDSALAVTALLFGVGVMLAFSAWHSSRAIRLHGAAALSDHFRAIIVALSLALFVVGGFTEILLSYYRAPWIEPLHLGREYDNVAGRIWGLDRATRAAVVVGTCCFLVSVLARAAPTAIRWTTASLGAILVATGPALQGTFNHLYLCLPSYGAYRASWGWFALVCLVGPTVLWFLSLASSRVPPSVKE